MKPEPHVLRWPGGELLLDSCKVMGVLNVTPDSFSDGGKFRDPRAAIERAHEIAKEGPISSTSALRARARERRR